MNSLLKFLFIISLLLVGLFATASYIQKDSYKESLKQISKAKGEIFSIGALMPCFPINSDSSALTDSLNSIDTLLIANKSTYRMKLYAKGKLLKTYRIALGQEPIGHKIQQGDNRTPEGVYKIIQKSRGPFYGAYANYLGVAWMRLNYPNNEDALNGFKSGLINTSEKNSIINANNSGKEPPKNTKLGGGIGIHGWSGSWPANDQQNLTWGCISVQNSELDDLYNRVPVGTTIIILKLNRVLLLA